MILPSLKEKAGALSFAMAALFAPIATLIPSSCGAACVSCPLTGGCLFIPAVAAGIGVFRFRSRIRTFLSRTTGQET